MTHSPIPLPRNTVDLTGQPFGRLTVLEYAGREPAPHAGRGGHALWLCECVCNARVTVRGARLRAGRIVSCGCQRADPLIRQAARLTIPERTRKRIARLGGEAFARLQQAP